MKLGNKPLLSFALFSIVSLHLLLSLNAIAGTEILMDTTGPGQAPGQSKMFIQNGKLRMDTQETSENGESQMIYDHGTKTMLMVDVDGRMYTLINEPMLGQLKSRMDAMKKQMEAQLANMPPEQREMMKNMMAGKMGMDQKAKNKPPKKVMKTDKTSSAGGYDCVVYEVKAGTKKVREFCVTEWSKFKNGNEVKTAMKGMNQFFGDFMESMQGMMPEDEESPFAEIDQLNGFPVIFKEYKNGKVFETATLKSVSDKSFSDDIFKAPKGFQQQQMMQGME